MGWLSRAVRQQRLRRAGPGDPRARVLIAGLYTLYQEIDRGDRLVDVSVTVMSDGRAIGYSVDLDTGKIERTVVDSSDPCAVLAAQWAIERIVVDATVPDMLP